MLGERLRLWREHRLSMVGNDPFLLAGFESRPGEHAWQGEHVGKWLHSATLAHQATGDPKLLAALKDTVRRLIATQEADGYLGTYEPDKRFHAPPGDHTPRSWDIWTHRYVIYGLLTYERFHPDESIVEVCTRIGDLLIEAFGPEKADLTATGTRGGISSSTVLESVMMLYERTGHQRFLDFAEHLHASMEANENLRVVSHLNAGGDVSIPGFGKAYQLMAVLLGYGDLFRFTGKPEYLEAAVKGWTSIREHHTYETGGPWSFKSDDTKNKECFTDPAFYHPTNVVENCSTTTWVQLSLQLLRITGDARYAREAERATLNHLVGSQAPNGTDYAYFTVPNCPRRDYGPRIHCCASSGPRALEMYARHLLGVSSDVLTIASYLPMTADLAGPARSLSIEGNYPFNDEVSVRLGLDAAAEFAVDWLLPEGAAGLTVSIDGQPQPLAETNTGFLRLERTWQPGEEMQVKFDFPPKAHFHDDRDGNRWVAFTRGPLALAQDVGETTPEPAPLTFDTTGEFLEPVAAPEDMGVSFRISGTEISVVPYYLAGATGGGVRTLFPVKHTPDG
ncbi:MAG: hypothetical protein GY953_24420 [bacterium]|nr:hypothetical protein [bacterium]